MSEAPETARHIAWTDPRFREGLAAIADPVFVIGPDHRVHVHDAVTELGLADDHRAWLAFIDDATGGSAETVFKLRGCSYYLNSDDYRRADPARFNRLATMLMAHDQGVQTHHAAPLFGTVVVTGYQPRTYLPRPLDGARLLANLDTLIANEQAAESAAEQAPAVPVSDHG